MCTHCLALRPEQLALDPLPPLLLFPFVLCCHPPSPNRCTPPWDYPSPLAMYLTEVYKMPTFLKLDRSFSEGKVRGLLWGHSLSTSLHCKKEKVSSTQIFKATCCTEFLSWRQNYNDQVQEWSRTTLFKFCQLSFLNSRYWNIQVCKNLIFWVEITITCNNLLFWVQITPILNHPLTASYLPAVPGEQWPGLGALLKGTSAVDVRMGEWCTTTSPTHIFPTAPGSNRQPSGYQPETLTSRPRLVSSTIKRLSSILRSIIYGHSLSAVVQQWKAQEYFKILQKLGEINR